MVRRSSSNLERDINLRKRILYRLEERDILFYYILLLRLLLVRKPESLATSGEASRN